MTQQPDSSRSSAPRRTGTISAVLLAVVALVGPTTLPASATGPTAERAPASTAFAGGVPATASAQGPVRVSVVDVSHPVAKPGDEVTIRAKVTNTTHAPVTDAVAQMMVDWEALTSRSDIAEWSTADLLDPVRGVPTSQSIPDLAPGASTNVTFTYDPGVQALQGFGARRLAIAVGDATGRLGIARSFLMYDADGLEREPMKLSVLASVTSPPTDPADPSTAEIELARRTADGQRLDGVLRVAEKTDLSLAIDPDVMGVAATSKDEALKEWSKRMLAAARNTATYTLPDHDPDLAALAHANVRTTGSRSFLQAPRTGDWEVPASWSSSLAWPADGIVPDTETVDLAVAADRPNVVVNNGGLAYEGDGTVTGRADVNTPSGTARAVVTDTILTQAFVSATDLSGAETVSSTENGADAAVTTGATTAEGTQRLLAETAAIVSQTPYDPPSLSIVAPRTWTPDAEGASTILKELDGADWVDTTTLNTLLAQDAQEVPRTPLPSHSASKAELGTTEVAELERARDAVVTFSSVATEDSSQIWRPGVARLAAPLAVAQRRDPGLRDLFVRQALRSTTKLTQKSVTVVPRQDINFITDVGKIPVRVRNGLGVDVTITVVLRPDHPRLTVDDRTTETIPAGQEIDVQVPVRAIGSGDVEVTAQVLTPTGAKISDDSSFQVRVRAGWEEVGTWIAAGLVALLFLSGIWRTVRRGRSPYRATREDVEEATGTAAEAPEPAAPAEPAPVASGDTVDSVTVRAE
ncbi:DUF6049 family protein [Promicromonospora sp. NPDC057138]|uniref:DUF6049 family protein n=1 Tax=Promicromonospora sp. NPDC057138 TaxID=3346031 RepID=UPI00363E94B0